MNLLFVFITIYYLLANVAMLPLNFIFLKNKITMFNITKSKFYSKFHGFSRHLTCVNAQLLRCN